MLNEQPILDIRNLYTQFDTREGIVHAVNGVSLSVRENEVLALVGESGSGKSVTMLSVMRLIPSPPGRILRGEVFFEGRDLLKLSKPDMRQIRGQEIAMIFQDPMSSLNPVLSVGRQIIEALVLHLGMDAARARRRAIELLDRVGIPEAHLRVDHYPFQFSGGMRQRVMIAMALSCNPRLLIADEPTTALDVTIQAQIVELVRQLQREFGMAVIWITHDLGLVATLADRVAVMYAGRIVERGPVEDIYARRRHPYTIGLLESIPRLDEAVPVKLQEIRGSPPDLVGELTGCAFAPRCEFADQTCRETDPPLGITDVPALETACWHWDKTDARSMELPGPTGIAARSGRGAGRAAENGADYLVRISDLTMHFPIRKGILQRIASTVRAVDGVNLSIGRGETLGLVGESGCGKTTLGRSLIRLYEPTSGRILFDGKDLLKLSAEAMQRLRRRMQLIFQDPYSSMNPGMKVWRIIGEPMQVHGIGDASRIRNRAAALLEKVGLSANHLDRYPHEFSGGQRQRIVIARALALNPDFVICDEPVSSLDVSVQAQIINLLEELQADLGLTYLFIAHDLAVVRHISDRVAVMYLGKIVELADHESIYTQPLHPYTQALLSAVPMPDPVTERSRTGVVLEGDLPSPSAPPPGCRFHTRCPIAEQGRCDLIEPEFREARPGHWVACHLV